MALTQEQIAKCRAWATAPSRHWQILNRAKWKYQFRGSAIVRYVEEVKMDEAMICDMLAYLTSDDCIPDLETYNQGITPESEYKPTKAWYEIGSKAAAGVRSVRLYHAISTDPDNSADGPFLVEDGCAYKVSLEYHWNEDSVPPVPASSSGVSYRITNISHDQETDRYSYVVETRERVQQDIAEYLMSQSVYAKASEEVHLGVKQDDVASTGQQVSVGEGKLVERKLSKNADCTSDVHNKITEELPVAGAVVKVDKTLDGIVRTTRNKSQPEPAPLTPEKPGSSVTNEKTPGGLYDQTIVEADETPLGVKGEGCGKTIFEHSHSTTENIPDRPTIDAPRAADGVVEKQSASMTRYGTWDVHKTVETELPVAKSSRTVRMTLNGEYVREESRNQPEPLPESGLRIGESVTNAKTPGGLYNTSHDIPSAKGAGKISERCHQDRFTHQHTQVENKGADAGDVAEHSFESGSIVDKAVSVQSNGTKDVTTSTTTPKPWSQRYDWKSGDTRHYVVKYGNQPSEFAGVYVPTDADSVMKNDHINAFGLHDGQVSWSYGPWRTWTSDLKFTKHGKLQKFYMSYMKPHDRRRYHRVKTIQVVFIRGDAYTDFLSRVVEADANSTQEGVLAVKLLDKYRDRDGNLLAEWVELRGFISAEEVCTKLCTHGMLDMDATRSAIDFIIKNFESSKMTSTTSDTTAEALRGLEGAIMASEFSGNTYAFSKRGRVGWSDGLGFEKAVAK